MSKKYFCLTEVFRAIPRDKSGGTLLMSMLKIVSVFGGYFIGPRPWTIKSCARLWIDFLQKNKKKIFRKLSKLPNIIVSW